MLSSTTTALSTSMPTASAMPPSDMMLSVTSKAYISTNVPSTETGIAMLVMSVARASRRNAVQHQDGEQTADQRGALDLADRRRDEVRLVVDRA